MRITSGPHTTGSCVPHWAIRRRSRPAGIDGHRTRGRRPRGGRRWCDRLLPLPVEGFWGRASFDGCDPELRLVAVKKTPLSAPKQVTCYLLTAMALSSKFEHQPLQFNDPLNLNFKTKETRSIMAVSVWTPVLRFVMNLFRVRGRNLALSHTSTITSHKAGFWYKSSVVKCLMYSKLNFIFHA